MPETYVKRVYINPKAQVFVKITTWTTGKVENASETIPRTIPWKDLPRWFELEKIDSIKYLGPGRTSS